MKKVISNRIYAAENTSAEELAADMIKKLESNFEYAISGIEKLVADGDYDNARQLSTALSEGVDSCIEGIAAIMA